MSVRYPLPYAFAKAQTLLLEEREGALVLCHADETPHSAMSEVFRVFAVTDVQWVEGRTLAERLAEAYAGGEGSADNSSRACSRRESASASRP